LIDRYSKAILRKFRRVKQVELLRALLDKIGDSGTDQKTKVKRFGYPSG
jgi:hypothetical protein